MRFEVKGADPNTGAEQNLTVDARDADEAETKARYSGVLVASVVPVVVPAAPVLDYRRPGTAGTAAGPSPAAAAPGDPAAPAAVVPAVPEYEAVLRRARRVDHLGAVALVVGYGSVVVGLLTALVALVSGDRVWGGAVADGARLAVVGALLLAGGAVMRLLASVGRAVRDMARNSFRR